MSSDNAICVARSLAQMAENGKNREAIFTIFRFHRIDVIFTAIADQTNHKRFFERLAKQAFQKISWFGFERKAL